MNLTRSFRRRRMSLTPMIDVVFLLLIFFMLAARFGAEGVIELTTGEGAGDYGGPPRLVDVAPNGITLNGVAVAAERLPESLSPLMSGPDDTIVLRARDEASLQHLIDVMEVLRDAGFTALVLVE